jgi:DNA-binding NarL/FixJ family response regulator
MNGHTTERPDPAYRAQRADRTGPAPRITVAVLDREQVSRAGVRAVLRRTPGLELVGDAADYATAAQLVRNCAPMVLVTRLSAGDNSLVPFLRWTREQPAGTRAVVLSGDPVPQELLFSVLRTGVCALLDAAGDAPRLAEAVRTVAAGGAVLAPGATETLLERFAGVDVERAERAADLIRTLSGREQEVLALIARGVDNAEIGRRLQVSVSAVKANVSRLLTKLRCENRVQAACLAQCADLLGQPGGRLWP